MNKQINNSVAKAMQIVRYIADHQGFARQIDVIRDLNIKKATAHRYLTILIELNLLEKKDNIYYLGLELLRLGNKVQYHKLIINRIRPYLHQIVRELNETVNLAQFINDRVIYLYRIESSRSLQLRANPGDRLPLHCTALGKAILSILPDKKLHELLTVSKLRRYTKSTSISYKALKREIEQIRTAGYSSESEEFEEGLVCAAVPLNSEKYNFKGALSFSGTTNRIDKKELIASLKKVLPTIIQIKTRIDE
jgi:DNA-binding IclR family transcriptional regulator